MGNRVLIQFTGTRGNGDREVSPAIYGHWSGSDAAATITALREQMSDRPGDIAYVAARCVGRLIDGDTASTGFGLWNAPKLLTAEESHGDAGVFRVDISAPMWRVTVIDGRPTETGSLVDTDNVRFQRENRG
jgi:hypothetical protein